MVKILTTFICVYLISFNSWSQIDKPGKDAKIWDLIKYDAGSMLGGVGYAYSRPLDWQGDDWLTLGGVVAGTFLLYTIDDETSNFFRKQSDDIPEVIKDYGWYYGSPQNNYAITGAVYLTAVLTKNEKWRRTGVLLISSSSAAGFLQQLAKTVTGRARPGEGRKKHDFKPFSKESGYHSFPSGHTVLAFTNAYALAKHFKNPWIKGGIYAIGMIPPVSRLWEGAHWLTDVALSMALSIATVEAIDRYLDKRYDSPYPRNKNKMTWNLKLGPGIIGISSTF